MKNKEKIITLIFYALLIITAIGDYIARNGEKTLRIILIGITIFLVSMIFSRTFLKKYSVLYDVVLFFIFIAEYLGNVVNFYNFKNYDKFLHITSGLILAVVGLTIFMYFTNYPLDNNIKKSFAIVFSMTFVIACAGVWEIWEFSVDQFFGLTTQLNSLHDTMWDIICGTTGGGISCFIICLYLRKKNKVNKKQS